MKKIEHVKSWFTSEEKFLKTPVGVFLLGAFLGTLAPSLTDPIHFWLVEHVLNNPAYSTRARAFFQILDWYFLDSLFYFLLLVLAYILHIKKVNTVKRITVVGSILGVGVVIGIIAKFIFKS